MVNGEWTTASFLSGIADSVDSPLTNHAFSSLGDHGRGGVGAVPVRLDRGAAALL